MAKQKGGLFGKDVGAGKEALFRVSQQPAETAKPTDLSPAGRKRRKDYQGTPSSKKNYHHSSVMLGVRVPNEVAQQVRKRAAASGQSVNAWLLALVMAELKKE